MYCPFICLSDLMLYCWAEGNSPPPLWRTMEFFSFINSFIHSFICSVETRNWHCYKSVTIYSFLYVGPGMYWWPVQDVPCLSLNVSWDWLKALENHGNQCMHCKSPHVITLNWSNLWYPKMILTVYVSTHHHLETRRRRIESENQLEKSKNTFWSVFNGGGGGGLFAGKARQCDCMRECRASHHMIGPPNFDIGKVWGEGVSDTVQPSDNQVWQNLLVPSELSHRYQTHQLHHS